MNKMIEEKYDAQNVKAILSYRKGKTYTAAVKNNKREEFGYGKKRKNTTRIEKGSGARAKTSPQQEKTLNNRIPSPDTEKKKGRKRA